MKMTLLAKSLTLPPRATFRSAIEKLNATRLGTLLVTEKNGKLSGIITDRDVRKAILDRKSLRTPVAQIMNGSFAACLTTESKRKVKSKLKKLVRLQMPIVDKAGKLVDVVFMLESFYGKKIVP